MAQFQLETRQALDLADKRRRHASDVREAKRTETQLLKEEARAMLAQEQREKEDAAREREAERDETAAKREARIIQMLSDSTKLLVSTATMIDTQHTQSVKDTQARLEAQWEREDIRDRRSLLQHCPSIAKLTRTEGLETFLTSFREHMVTYGIPNEYWVMQLTKALDDRSAEYLRQLEGPEKYDFESATNHLLKFHQINTSHYRKRWDSLTFQSNETGQQHAQRISLLWTAWSKDARTRKDMADMVMREKFISNLSPATQEWVKQRNPATLNEAAELADTHIASRPSQYPQQRRPPRRDNYKGNPKFASPE